MKLVKTYLCVGGFYYLYENVGSDNFGKYWRLLWYFSARPKAHDFNEKIGFQHNMKLLATFAGEWLESGKRLTAGMEVQKIETCHYLFLDWLDKEWTRLQKDPELKRFLPSIREGMQQIADTRVRRYLEQMLRVMMLSGEQLIALATAVKNIVPKECWGTKLGGLTESAITNAITVMINCHNK